MDNVLEETTMQKVISSCKRWISKVLLPEGSPLKGGRRGWLSKGEGPYVEGEER